MIEEKSGILQTTSKCLAPHKQQTINSPWSSSNMPIHPWLRYVVELRTYGCCCCCRWMMRAQGHASRACACVRAALRAQHCDGISNNSSQHSIPHKTSPKEGTTWGSQEPCVLIQEWEEQTVARCPAVTGMHLTSPVFISLPSFISFPFHHFFSLSLSLYFSFFLLFLCKFSSRSTRMWSLLRRLMGSSRLVTLMFACSKIWRNTM